MFYAGKPMLEEAKAYADYVKSLMVGPHSELFVESQVSILPEYDVSGHVDACVIDGSTLHVIDLKTGRGAVSAENNLQMQLYAIGLYEEHEMFYEIETIKLHIVQDNDMIHNTNSWELSVDELMDFKDWISERARLALQEDSVCTPNPQQCQWCDHKDKCVALNESVMDIVNGEFESLDELMEETGGEAEMVSQEAILKLVENEKLITDLIKAYKDRLTSDLLAGEKIDGYKLVQTTKRKKWVNENEAYKKIKGWMTVPEFEDFAPRKLCTPTQAAKMLKGKMTSRKENIFETLFEVPEGDITFAPVSDKRKEYIPAEGFDDLDDEL